MAPTVKVISEIYNAPFGEAFIVPRGYDASFKTVEIKDLKTYTDDTKISIIGKASNFRVKGSGKILNIYADLVDGENKIMLHWTSSKEKAEYKKSKLEESFIGKKVFIVGSISSYGEGDSKFVFISKIKQIEENVAGCQTALVPVYELKKSVKPFELLNAIKNSIQVACENKIALPNHIAEQMGLPNLKESLLEVHCLPNTPINVTNVSLEEMLEGQSPYHKRIKIELLWRTLKTLKEDGKETRSPVLLFDKKGLQELETSLNVALTIEQKKALGSIFKTFKSGVFRRTLLQGDVGSGKTFVSIFASATVVRNKFKVAVIAPSSVLAKQLFHEYERAFIDSDVKIIKAYGVLTKKQRDEIQKHLSAPDPVIIIGTSTVNGFDYNNLGLVIVDEEQKIGVTTKDFLINKYADQKPYQILMSATPIPRSLASALFGNVDIVVIAAKPAGRLPVLTKIIKNETDVQNLFNFIKKEWESKRTSIIIAPSIESDEIASIKTVAELCKKHLSENAFEYIHGKMTETEVSEIVSRFKNGEFQLLIATSMVEAGFDIPTISTAIIVSPDRFGLSQLHQMRGRAGRKSGVQSYCALFPLDFKMKEQVLQRLIIFAKNHDGFFLANEDLQNRGSGTLVGTTQSGNGNLNFIENFEDVILLKSFL